jgi:hypothetical protein
MSEGNSGPGIDRPTRADENPTGYNEYKVIRTLRVESAVTYTDGMSLEEVRSTEEEYDDIMVSIDGDDDNEVKVTELRVEHA